MGENGSMTSPTTGRQGPSSIWFVIGGVLVALGVIGGIAGVVIGARQVSSTVDDYQRVSASAGGEFSIDEPGTYRIFYEAPGAADGFTPVPIFEVVGPGGDSVEVRADTIDENYTFGSREGRKIGKFTAATSGTYGIQVQRSDGLSVSGPVFAIGERGPTGSILTIVGGVLGGLGVAAIGGVVLIVAGVGRGRAKRRHLAPAAGWAAPPQAWGGPQPGWGSPPQAGWGTPSGGSGGPQGWVAPPQGGSNIPASQWGTPPSGGTVPQGTQWGVRPDSPDPAPPSSPPPGWAPPPAASPPPPPPPTHGPPPDGPPPPPQGPTQ